MVKMPFTLIIVVVQNAYQKVPKKKELGYFQVNSEILETQISSSSKFVPEKNSSGIFKFELEIS